MTLSAHALPDPHRAPAPIWPWGYPTIIGAVGRCVNAPLQTTHAPTRAPHDRAQILHILRPCRDEKNFPCNYTTGATVAAQSIDGRFDCSALPKQQGDAIGTVLFGMAGDGPGGGSGGGSCAQPLQEVESNDDINQGQFQDLGTLQAGGCIAVAASTSAGYGSDPNNPDPNADVDWYVINTASASQPMFGFLDLQGALLYGIFDLDTGQRLEVQPSGDSLAILGQPAKVAIRVRTEQPTTYTLQFSDGTAGGGLSSLDRARHLGHIIHESR